MSLVGAMLAGGKSTRMGSPKVGLRLPSGKLMGCHNLQLLEQLTDHQVVLGWPNELLKPPDIHLLDDQHKNAGPLAGITSLLSSGLGTRYLIIPCDMPLLSVELLGLLVSARANAVSFEAPHDQFHPLPMVLDANVRQIAEHCLRSSERSLRGFLVRSNVETLPISQEQSKQLQSFNTPGEFQSLSETMRSAPE